jgi:hypothetical protein
LKLTANSLPDLRHIVADVGNDGVRVRNSYVRGHRKLGLEVVDQLRPTRNEQAYVEDVKDPVQLQLPTGDRLLVVPCMEKSRDHVPSALFDDLLLDLRHSSATKSAICELSKLCITGLTHVVN